MSLCKTCSFRLNTWGETLRSTHDGCLLLALPNDALDESMIEETIKAKFIGLGWITNGDMAINSMIITQEVSSCKRYQKDYLLEVQEMKL